MPITRTSTYLATYPRKALIELLVTTILRRVTMDTSAREAIIKGIKNNWINGIFLYGINASHLCLAEFDIKIDWERANVILAASKETEMPDSRWHDEASVEVEKAAQLFFEYALEERLSVDVRVGYLPSAGDQNH